MKRTKRYAGRGCNTHRLHHKHLVLKMDKDVKELWDFLNKASSDRDVQVEKLEKRVEELERKLSVYDGGESGSTGAE